MMKIEDGRFDLCANLAAAVMAAECSKVDRFE